MVVSTTPTYHFEEHVIKRRKVSASFSPINRTRKKTTLPRNRSVKTFRLSPEYHMLPRRLSQSVSEVRINNINRPRSCAFEDVPWMTLMGTRRRGRREVRTATMSMVVAAMDRRQQGISVPGALLHPTSQDCSLHSLRPLSGRNRCTSACLRSTHSNLSWKRTRRKAKLMYNGRDDLQMVVLLRCLLLVIVNNR